MLLVGTRTGGPPGARRGPAGTVWPPLTQQVVHSAAGLDPSWGKRRRLWVNGTGTHHGDAHTGVLPSPFSHSLQSQEILHLFIGRSDQYLASADQPSERHVRRVEAGWLALPLPLSLSLSLSLSLPLTQRLSTILGPHLRVLCKIGYVKE